MTVNRRCRQACVTARLLAATALVIAVRPATAANQREFQKLIADDAAPNDLFGSVAITADTVIVGAPASITGGNRSAGYIFHDSGTGIWNQTAKLSASDDPGTGTFGESVAISGNLAIVGAGTDDSNGSGAGSAYLFQGDAFGNWRQIDKLLPGDPGIGDFFGYSVGLDGETAIVGAYMDDTPRGQSAGSAYVFQPIGSGAWQEVAKLTASDGAASDLFGRAVAVSGNTAIVGAVFDDDRGRSSGSAYIFRDSGAGNWNQIAKLSASDGTSNALFGHTVAIAGNTAVIGAVSDDDFGPSSGSAYVFREGELGIWNQVAKLTASNGAAGDTFGFSVGISGNLVVVGARRTGDKPGSAYVFEVDDAGDWREIAILTPRDAAAGNTFGNSVAIAGITAIVGANFDGEAGLRAGAAYLFQIPEPCAGLLAILGITSVTASRCRGKENRR